LSVKVAIVFQWMREDPFMKMPIRKILISLEVIALVCSFHGVVGAQSQNEVIAQLTSPKQKSQKVVLHRAVMCESVQDLKPVNEGIAFPVSVRQVSCFTSFKPILEETAVYHRWFYRDELSTQIQLKLYPPEWNTYSSMQLRDTDKGPWRVEIADRNGFVFQILRFSITD
jgi:hypothetical protein